MNEPVNPEVFSTLPLLVTLEHTFVKPRISLSASSEIFEQANSTAKPYSAPRTVSIPVAENSRLLWRARKLSTHSSLPEPFRHDAGGIRLLRARKSTSRQTASTDSCTSARPGTTTIEADPTAALVLAYRMCRGDGDAEEPESGHRMGEGIVVIAKSVLCGLHHEYSLALAAT